MKNSPIAARREVPWHKVPSVPRPSQVPPCFTVYGTRSVPDVDGVKLPGFGKGQTYHRLIPSVAHKRLVTVTPSAHVTRTRQSVLLGEIDRIYHKVRPTLAYQPTEDYLNSHSAVSFDDETRSIRAKTAELLKRIHTPVPRAQRPMPLPGEPEITRLPDDWHRWYSGYPEELGQTRLRMKLSSLKRDLQDLMTNAYYSHTELPITDRISSDNYIDRLLSANKDVSRDINTMSYFDQPAKHYNSIGRGHLACVSFAGGRPISRRRNLADGYIKDDINVLSHYGRFRKAAAVGSNVPPTEPEYAPPIRRPPTKSSVTGSWKSNAPRSQKQESSKSGSLNAGDEFDAAQDRKQRRRDAVEAAAAKEVEEEKRRKNEISRQEQLAQQAIADRDLEIERKARDEEEASRRREEEERLLAERLAKEEEERAIREEEERLAREEEELRLKEEEELARKLKEEEEKKLKKAKKEAEKKAKEEAEKKAREEAEEKARLEAEQKAKEEEERKAKEEAERLAKEEAERLAKEEAERLAKEEAERLQKEEEERIAKEEAERKAKEEEETAAKEAAAAAAAEGEAASQDTATETTVGDDEAASTVAAEEPPSETADSAVTDEPVVEEPAESVAEEEKPTASEVEEVANEEDE